MITQLITNGIKIKNIKSLLFKKNIDFLNIKRNKKKLKIYKRQFFQEEIVFNNLMKKLDFDNIKFLPLRGSAVDKTKMNTINRTPEIKHV